MPNARRIMEILEVVARDVIPETRIGSRIAAAVVHKGRIISIGTNRKKTHPFQAKFGKNDEAIYLHAETDAIQRAMRATIGNPIGFEKCHFYIFRSKWHDDLGFLGTGLAKPCAGCTRAIEAYGFKTVTYTLDGKSFQTFDSLD
jgi:deoxycytidylate deaminase